MAWTGNFKTQIEDLAGTLSVTDDGATQQWIIDGCYDVLAKATIKYGPEEVWKFAIKSGNFIANGIDVDEVREITGVFRRGIHANRGIWALQTKYGDTGSIYAATESDPVWVLDDNKLNVYPTPDGASVANYYYIPEYSLTSWDSAVSSIANFPSEYYYHVMLFASIQTLHRKMLDKSVPATPVLATVSYSAPASSVVADTPDMIVEDMEEVSSIINVQTSAAEDFTYTEWLASYASILNDPSTLTVSIDRPSVPAISAQVVEAFGTAPAYTAPKVGGASELLTDSMTALSSDTYGTDNDFLDYSRWFTVASEFIEDEEDIELANAQLQKISTYLNSYSIAMQNALNVFNDANVEYQANIQHLLKEADLLDSNESKKLQKYNSEISSYQAAVNKEIQEWQANFSRWQLQLTTYTSSWQTEYGSRVQEAAANAQAVNNATMQNLQKNLTIAQANLQKSQNEAQTNHSTSAAKAQTDAQLNQTKLLQDAIQTTEAIMQNNNVLLGKYQADLQKEQADYQWIQDQHNRLKAEYLSLFSLQAQEATE